jgi:alkaline phosphatase D
VIRTDAAQDFTAKVPLEGLRAGTTHRYRILTSALDDRAVLLPIGQPSAEGRFDTAPSHERSEPVRFLWAGDLGGQQHCRQPWSGYDIFEQMLRQQPAFALLIGDLIYGDDRCPAPPNVPGSDFLASSLDEYRAKHRYQRGDSWLQRFLAAVPVYVIWDDHEVRNNFSGLGEPLMPAGRQALLDYWPIQTPPEEPSRLYRRIRRGADLELFILDTRQYRSPNSEKDGPGKTMLGAVQRQWLLDGLAGSTATWKVIVTSVPLSNPKGGSLHIPGNDSWARGTDGTGFQHELGTIVRFILDRRIRNVAWVAGDVHYAQVNAYDPNGDGMTDFHEFICGPLSAAAGQPLPPHPAFRPTTLYSAGGFPNFGMVTVDERGLRVAIIDNTGTVRFERSIPRP